MVHTEEDVRKLSHQLGLSPDAVRAMLDSHGGGGSAPPSASRRSSAAAAPPRKVARVEASPWADFMTGESAAAPPAPAAAATAASAAKSAVAEEADPPPAPRPAEVDLAAAPRTYGPVAPRAPGSGLLCMTGTLDAASVGRSKRPAGYRPQCYDLEAPTVLTPSVFSKRKVQCVAASSSGCHSLCVSDGDVYGWGRNEGGQLGGLPLARCVWIPTLLDGNGRTSPAVACAVGKSHSVVLAADGSGWGAGHNKFGQCAVGSTVETVANWKKMAVQADAPTGENGAPPPDVQLVRAACGENFTVAVDAAGRLYTAGHGEHGCLGAGYTGEHFVAANKLAFATDAKLVRRSRFVTRDNVGTSLGDGDNGETLPRSAEIRIGSVACGKSHVVAVEQSCTEGHPGRVFTWGNGAYGCLGHRVQADEYLPRVVDSLTGPIFKSNGPVSAACGAQCSMIITMTGHLYYWGKHKTAGEATMRPAPVEQLVNNGHVVVSCSGGNQTAFACTANGVTVGWGNGPHGELGYGRNGAKSSSKPKFVEGIDAVLARDVQCGYGHTLFILTEEDEEDKKALKKVPVVEVEAILKDAGGKNITGVVTGATKAGPSSTKKKGRGKK